MPEQQLSEAWLALQLWHNFTNWTCKIDINLHISPVDVFTCAYLFDLDPYQYIKTPYFHVFLQNSAYRLWNHLKIGPTLPSRLGLFWGKWARFLNSVKSMWKYIKFAIIVIKYLILTLDPPYLLTNTLTDWLERLYRIPSTKSGIQNVKDIIMTY